VTVAPNIDVRTLGSVRRAAAETEAVALGEDWIAPDPADGAAAPERSRRGTLRELLGSPLARKIVTFNILALSLIVVGLLFLNPSRHSLGLQRAHALVDEAMLIASVLASDPAAAAAAGPSGALDARLASLDLRSGVSLYVFDAGATELARLAGPADLLSPDVIGLEGERLPTPITDALIGLRDRLVSLAAAPETAEPAPDIADLARTGASRALAEGAIVRSVEAETGQVLYLAATPILQGDTAAGAVALVSRPGEIDRLVRHERETLLRMFLAGVAVSVLLSLMLASTIANPLSELAAAAETGQDRNTRKRAGRQVRIPDLTARPDEIGRLSEALRGMVSALYRRIETNEQFAADVAHEIKNPLASLRSAVGTLRVVKREDQRAQLLDVIEHDVQRLDRLVSDISNASRLDAELVKEEESSFELQAMLQTLAEHLGREAGDKGVEFICDLPSQPIQLHGLEGRLAQVFVNLISNAISFCEDGDAIRLWARMRENRVLIVVEDTGPGIPDEALNKIFKRFYSERPAHHFGNNSGLGLAISKQIVEAHGGVIWAENIRPTEADPGSDPLGARFVVGLPV